MGTWQLQRLEWKENIISSLEKSRNLPPFTNIPESGDILYKKVSLTGSFNYKNSIIIQAKYLGDRLGYQVIAPFSMKDKKTVLVNIGWFPKDIKNPSIGTEKITTISGLITQNKKTPPWFLPQNDIDNNIWYWEVTEQVISFFNKKYQYILPPIIVHKANNDGNAAYPIPLDTKINIKNNHLGYAITWYSLALGIIIMYLVLIRTTRKKP